MTIENENLQSDADVIKSLRAKLVQLAANKNENLQSDADVIKSLRAKGIDERSIAGEDELAAAKRKRDRFWYDHVSEGCCGDDGSCALN